VRLTQFWMTSMETARTAVAEPGQTAPRLAGQIQADLERACASALDQGYASADIQSALFAVVAWIDEIAMTHPWAGAAEWRLAPLQRHYFSTTRAGSEFFERLDALPDESTDVREVYALALLAGFSGRYSYRPAGELAGYRQNILSRVAEERAMAPLLSSEPLFPDAGELAKAPSRRSRGNFPSFVTFLLIAIPVTCLAVLYIVLDHHASAVAAQLVAPLSSQIKP